MTRTPGLHECLICKKTFARRDALRRHKSVHADRMVPCPKCGATFRRPDNMKRHLRTLHENTAGIGTRQSEPSTVSSRNRIDTSGPTQPESSTHRPETTTLSPQNQSGTPGPTPPTQPQGGSDRPEEQQGCSHWSKPAPKAPTHLTTTSNSAEEQPGCGPRTRQPLPVPASRPTRTTTSRHKCSKCGKSFLQADSLQRHYTKVHAAQNDTPTSPEPATDQFCEDPLLYPEGGEDELSQIIRENWDSIRSYQMRGNLLEDTVNIRIVKARKNYKNIAKKILEKLTNGEFINVSFGAVVRHDKTGEIRFFDANTARFFPAPVTFDNEFFDRFDYQRIADFVHQYVKDSSVVAVTNVRIFIRHAPDPLQEDPVEFPPQLDINDDELSRVYRDNWAAIRTHHLVGRVIQDIYNVRMDRPGSSFAGIMNAIFRRLTCRAKINVSCGFILRNVETGELRYFHPSHNNATLFPTPFTIGCRDDMDILIHELETMDVVEHVRQQRPDTKWSVMTLTNIAVYVNKMPQFYIGTPPRDLPDFIKNNRGLHSLTHKPNTWQRYDDNLCFFRCLALHRGADIRGLERSTHELAETFQRATGKRVSRGVTLEDLTEAERIFEVTIQVYNLTRKDDNGDGRPQTQVHLIRRSHRRYPSKLHLNLFDDHFSYIFDLDKYSQTFECQKCRMVFDRSFNLQRHVPTCNANVKHRFPGGVYNLPETIFDKLEEAGISVEEDLKYYPYRATYDYECYFDQVADQNVGQQGKLTWCNRHELLSVSVASNVPNFETTRCFVSDGDPADLVLRMVNYLHEISQAASENLTDKFEGVFVRLREFIQRQKDQAGEGQQERRDVPTKKLPGEKLQEELEHYLEELPVIGFNSSRYDINVIKKHLYNTLKQAGDPVEMVIKRGGSYMSLQTKKLKFLDISNYLAPGYSYAKFLKAYECPHTKGFFPYEYMTDLNKLDETALPPHAAFFSTLKGENISEEDYRYCQRIWRDGGMTTLRQFLEWYNNLDVLPFLDAIQKMFTFYKDRQMDMFKMAISVPGLSLQYLFLTLPESACSSLIDEPNKDLYYLLKKNIVGGPSIVFHRYQEKGKTQIRGGPKKCANVVGFDANALYLWSLMQPMPVGTFIRRREEDGFKPVPSHKWGVKASGWLDWVAQSDGIFIRHQFNRGEKRVGAKGIPVDGFCKETNTAYQFHGCFWHGHQCHLNPHHFNTVKNLPRDELRRQTEATSSYIRAQGHNLIEMWECEWDHLLSSDVNAAEFVKSRQLPHQNKTLNQRDILEAVVNEEIFGLVECDLEVPVHLREKFAEMPPIFKNVDITREDIGDHMREYAEREGLMKTPRRSLIGSMFGRRILLTTPLLNWYIKHGLNITHIYQVVQYRPAACFQPFGEAVSNARRDGDVDPSKAIIADTMKLLGNSAYGKTVTNQERHLQVQIAHSSKTVSRLINHPNFRAVHTLDEELYEVELNKKAIRLSLPLQIGFFVYQYAKLRMLEFYYSFLLRFIHPSDFQLCEMDTDSAYLAISSERLEDIIQPHLRDEYQREKSSWFPRDDTAANRAFDKRTPGLFKIEWEGDGIVALCSKSYYCFGAQDKVSCKGINKKTNDITKRRYLQTLETQQVGEGVNRGFRMRQDGMHTYHQVKTAFTYLYPKRKVAADGVSTTYLDI